MTSDARTVTLRRLTAEQFPDWSRAAVTAYAEDTARAHGTTVAAETSRAEAQLPQLLPDGADTEGVWIFHVCDEDGTEVGSLWLGPSPDRPEHAFVWDVRIEEKHRGQGFGRAAMLAAEGVVRDAGFGRLALNVFGFNTSARGLYTSLGYRLTGSTMVKDLTATGDAGSVPTAPPAASLGGDVGRSLARVGAALDAFLAAGGDAVARRSEWTAALLRDLPDEGVGAETVLDELVDVVVPNGARMAKPGFWGWITTGPDTVPLVASTAAALASPQRYSITAFNLLEEVSLRWLADLAGLSTDMLGVYSSGGSVANLVALGAARQWAYEQRGVDPSADGVDATPVAIYASAEVHHTVQRSAAVLGLGRSSVRIVPTDGAQRMRVDLLRQALTADRSQGIVPIAVVATAGTTNTGAVDPIRAVGELAHEFGAWFHVDGAYGLLGSLDERVAPLYDGLDLADSVIVDPHKWLGAPTGIGATFVRDRSILFRAFTQEPAPYLETVFATEAADAQSSLDSVGIPYSEFGVELSAPARGAVVWSILRELGRNGVATRIRRDNDHARRLAELVLAHPRLELLAEPVLSICCFRYAADGIDDLDLFNATLLRRLHRGSPFLPSSTRVDGTFALRPCFINPRTADGDVDRFVAEVVALGDELKDAPPAGW